MAPADLAAATDVDSVARLVLRELLAVPGVHRVGIALSEGGGRRLRFLGMTAADLAPVDGDGSSRNSAVWRHIDAYDDVPLTDVVRSGELVLGDLGDFGDRYRSMLARERDLGSCALAAVPLPGVGSPIGGLVVIYDRPQRFDAEQRSRLAAAGRAAAEAVRRVRARTGRAPAEAPAEAPGISGRPTRTETILLAGDPRAAGAARHFLREVLAEWGIEGEPVESAELCLSELVTNAVIHAGTSSELTLNLDGEVLTVVVRDLGGSTRPGDVESTVHLSEDEDPLRVFGRGLVLVDALAARWGSEADATGTTSWFVLELDGLATATC